MLIVEKTEAQSHTKNFGIKQCGFFLSENYAQDRVIRDNN